MRVGGHRIVKLTKPDWHTVAGAFACVVLLTLPFAHSVAIRTVAGAVAWIATLVAWRSLAVPRIPLLWLFAAWAALGALSLTWAIDPEYSASELKTELLYPFLTFVLFFVLSDLAWLERFRRTLMVATVLALVSALYWVAFSDPGSAAGFFNGPGMYSTYLVAVYPFALVWVLRPSATGKERALDALLMLGIFAGGALTLNRMLWIVLALQTVLVLGAQASRRLDATSFRRLAMIATATALVFGGALYGISSKRFVVDPAAPEAVAETAAKDIRFRIWSRAVERIVDQPFAGAGFGRGALREEFRVEFESGLHWHAHNVVLNHGLAMGVWGIAIILLAFGAVLVVLWRVWRTGDAAVAPYGLAGVAMVAGMLLKNMTDDLFIRQSALLYWALAGMILGAHARQRRLSEPRSILVVRRDNIGDLVCTTPLLMALRDRFPHAWIGVYANDYNAPVLAGHPAIDEVFTYRKSKHYRDASGLVLLAERVAQIFALWRRRLDWVVLATPADHPRLRRVTRLLAQGCVAGFTAAPSGRHGLDYAVGLDVIRNVHEVEAVFRLAGAFGITGAPPPLHVAVDPEERERIARALDHWPPSGPIIGVHVSARKPSQRWPAERFVALMRALHERHAARFILFWSPGSADHRQHPGDDDKGRTIVAGLAGVPVLAWETHALPGLVAGLAACDSVVCSDGGAMHIAAALGKRIVCFFGKSDATRWRPWGVPCEVLQPASCEAEDITVEEALAAYERLDVTGPGPSDRQDLLELGQR